MSCNLDQSFHFPSDYLDDTQPLPTTPEEQDVSHHMDISLSSANKSANDEKEIQSEIGKSEHIAMQDCCFISETELSAEVQEFLERCSAFAHYYEVLSPVRLLERNIKEQCNMSPPVQLYTVAVQSPHILLLLEGSRCTSHTVAEEGAASVAKLVVHHQYCSDGASVQRYVVLLRTDQSLTVLTCPDMQVVSEYSSVRDVLSKDAKGCGRPVLSIVKCSGEVLTWSPLLSDGPTEEECRKTHPPTTPAQRQVALALQGHLHRAVSLVSSVSRACLQREVFIVRRMATLREAVRGDALPCQREGQVARASALPVNVRLAGAVSQGVDGLCSVSSVRYKVLHDSLVLCVAVHNTCSRYVLAELSLVLHTLCPHTFLHYTTSVYKGVIRRSKREGRRESAAAAPPTVRSVEGAQRQFASFGGSTDADAAGLGPAVTSAECNTVVEEMKPCLLRPKKQAFVIAKCALPCFITGPSVTFTGLLQFKARPLSSSSSHLEPSTTRTYTKTSLSSGNASSDKKTLHFTEGISPQSKEQRVGQNDPPQSLRASPVLGTSKRSSEQSGALGTRDTDSSAETLHQVPLKPVSLTLAAVEKARVNFASLPPRAEVSLDSVSLVSCSRRHEVLLRSAVCGVTMLGLLQGLRERYEVFKLPDLRHHYVLCPTAPLSPLHLVCLAFPPAPSSLHTLRVTLHCRDYAQILAIVHTLRSLLPFDATIALVDTEDTSDPTPHPHKLSSSAEQEYIPPDQDERCRRLFNVIKSMVEFLVQGASSKFNLEGQSKESDSNSNGIFEKKLKTGDDGTRNDKNKNGRSSSSAVDETETLREEFKEACARFQKNEEQVTVSRGAYAPWKEKLLQLQRCLDAAYVAADT